MSFKCSVCGKGPVSGKTISHSHRATNRTFRPNLQRIRTLAGGKVKRVYVCSTCLKSGKIVKAVS